LWNKAWWHPGARHCGSGPQARSQPWRGALEATLFSSWIYDTLQPYSEQPEMAHPAKRKAIRAGKKKSDTLDARTIADLMRCNLLPACYVAAPRIRELRHRMSEVGSIDLSKLPHDKASYGSTLVLYDGEREEEVTYRLVTPEESDPAAGLISTVSPIGRSLMGKQEGDEVVVLIGRGRQMQAKIQVVEIGICRKTIVPGRRISGLGIVWSAQNGDCPRVRRGRIDEPGRIACITEHAIILADLRRVIKLDERGIPHTVQVGQ
jgi:transcription elongation GreA/GreB family factor